MPLLIDELQFELESMKFDHEFETLRANHEIMLSTINTEKLIYEYADNKISYLYETEMEVYMEGVKEWWERFKAWVRNIINKITGKTTPSGGSPDEEVEIPFDPDQANSIISKARGMIKNITNFQNEDGSLNKEKVGGALGIAAGAATIGAMITAALKPRKKRRKDADKAVDDVSNNLRAASDDIDKMSPKGPEDDKKFKGIKDLFTNITGTFGNLIGKFKASRKKDDKKPSEQPESPKKEEGEQPKPPENPPKTGDGEQPKPPEEPPASGDGDGGKPPETPKDNSPAAFYLEVNEKQSNDKKTVYKVKEKRLVHDLISGEITREQLNKILSDPRMNYHGSRVTTLDKSKWTEAHLTELKKQIPSKCFTKQALTYLFEVLTYLNEQEDEPPKKGPSADDANKAAEPYVKNGNWDKQKLVNDIISGKIDNKSLQLITSAGTKFDGDERKFTRLGKDEWTKKHIDDLKKEILGDKGFSRSALYYLQGVVEYISKHGEGKPTTSTDGSGEGKKRSSKTQRVLDMLSRRTDVDDSGSTVVDDEDDDDDTPRMNLVEAIEYTRDHSGHHFDDVAGIVLKAVNKLSDDEKKSLEKLSALRKFTKEKLLPGRSEEQQKKIDTFVNKVYSHIGDEKEVKEYVGYLKSISNLMDFITGDDTDIIQEKEDMKNLLDLF